MNKERSIITTIAGMLPRSSDQLNGLFESDSEILSYNGKNLLFTVDDYSKEDRFREHDPYTLGWNLTVATISDILASGGVPRYFAHSLVINETTWDQKYIADFSRGIADVLKRTGASFIGGDTGTAEDWHYTGIALGEAGSPLTRKGAAAGDIVLMTGQIGAGNLEAAIGIYSENPLIDKLLKHYKTRLSIRNKESVLIGEFATSCIDSSDGVLLALITLSDINNTGFELTHVPYLFKGLAACRILSKPAEMLLLGECGEYELVFTIPEKDLNAFLQKAEDQHLVFTPIGRMIRLPERSLITSKKRIDFSDFDIRGRDYSSISLYLEELTHYLTSHEKSKQ